MPPCAAAAASSSPSMTVSGCVYRRPGAPPGLEAERRGSTRNGRAGFRSTTGFWEL